jgi:hypothetical protein
MADVAQVIATYDALVGVALGAGLTYGLGALNRRHQEAREDKTRWYEARFKAYAELSRAFSNCLRAAHRDKEDMEAREDAVQELSWAAGAIRYLSSDEVVAAAEMLVSVVVRELQSERPVDSTITRAALVNFENAARKDLGHP